MPANSDRPGRPALLPGSVLRIMVSKVGVDAPPLTDISLDPFSRSIAGAGAIVVGNRMASSLLSRKYACVDLLQRRPLHGHDVRIGGAEDVGGDGAERALHVGAGNFCGDIGKRDAFEAGCLQICRDIGNRLV